jgi:hypothetical protein
MTYTTAPTAQSARTTITIQVTADDPPLLPGSVVA